MSKLKSEMLKKIKSENNYNMHKNYACKCQRNPSYLGLPFCGANASSL